MKPYLLLLSLFIFSCVTEPEDKHGCLDSQACNYDSTATIDNNSCIYEEDCAGVCGGETVVDDCGNCVGQDLEYVELWGVCFNIEETTELNASGIGLTGVIPPEIGNLTNLTNLYLGGNQFTGEIPSTIGNLTNLTSLYLSYNQLSGEIPEEICNLPIMFDESENAYLIFLAVNKFCPPYPVCDYGEITSEEQQDTSECE